MSRTLIIVESPSKCKTIKSILGSDFEIIASVGHINQVENDNNSISITDHKLNIN